MTTSPATKGTEVPTVITVGTYPPTRCGLATFTANLGAALQLRGLPVKVIRLAHRDELGGVNRPEVLVSWCRDDSGAPSQRVIAAANSGDVLLVQHEFGIFPGADGDSVIELLDSVSVPVVSVLHTVLARPSEHQRRILLDVVERSERVVVQTEAAQLRLVNNYGVDESVVEVIPHGAALNLSGPVPLRGFHPRLLTWGLLGPGKGLEHAIDAVALLARRGMATSYVIAGDVHPGVFANDGNAYRNGLQARAAERGVADRVEFDGGYRDWKALRELVRSADLVVLPYDSREQVTSGVLVEAIAAGKPVVATAFPHAVELSATGAVTVVPHERPEALARAIHEVLVRPGQAERMALAARSLAASHDWPAVAARYAAVLRTAARGSSSLVVGQVA